jgi:hypothetical protein
MPVKRLRSKTIALVVPLLLAAQASGAAPRPIQAIPVDLNVPFSPAPVKADGQLHLDYELHLANMGTASLTLKRLEVLDGDAIVAAYESDALNGILSRPGTTGLTDKRVIAAGLGAVAFIDVSLEKAPKSAITHRLVFEPVTPANAGEQTEVTGGTVRLDPRPPIVLGPPLRGSGWLASHALSATSSHRRTLLTLDGRAAIAQRYAIDWTQIASDGQIFRGDPSKNGNWTPYGNDVLAVASGKVVEIVDGLPENDPTSDTKAIAITVDNAAGNHLILDLGDGRYVLYAHLKPGSFRVHEGDTVREGQVIAALGNTGKSDAPHLHFQVMNRPSPLAAEGLPFVFRRFTLAGHVDSLKVFVDGTGWRANSAPQPRIAELPLENDVVGF